MAVYGYCRVSTAMQADEGESLGAQQRMVEGYAQVLGQPVTRVFVERGISGSKPLDQRPEGAALLAVLQPGDSVITSKLDRMFRSALDALGILASLQKKGVGLHMIDLGGDVCGNGISKLVFTILSAVAEAERDRIRERIMDVKNDQRKRGRFLGGAIPFGYEVEWKVDKERSRMGVPARYGVLVEHPAQQTAIARMREMRDTGASLRAIEEQMRVLGFKLSHQGVKNVLSAQVA